MLSDGPNNNDVDSADTSNLNESVSALDDVSDPDSAIFKGFYRLEGLKSGITLERGPARLHVSTRPSGVKQISMSELVFHLGHPTNGAIMTIKIPAGLHLDPKIATRNSIFGLVKVSPENLTEEFYFSGEVAGSRVRDALLPGVPEDGAGLSLDKICIVRSGHLVIRGGSVASGEMVAEDCGFRLTLEMQGIDIRSLGRKVVNYSILCNVRRKFLSSLLITFCREIQCDIVWTH